ncbi:hypothetical protein KBB48_01870 [Candidatus Shapirobacteria bacterium]|nr:hypothetical protein [Candidatus Shapirobacteria bacterium]
MKKILLLALIFSFFPSPVVAQSPTVSTSEIQNLREVIQQKVLEKLEQIREPVTENPRKAYLGSITEITDTKIIIDTKNQLREFILAEDSVYIGSKQTKIKRADLKVGQDVLVLSLNKDTLIYAKRILVTDPKKIQNHKTVVLGQIADISKSSPIFVLIPTNNKNRDLQIKILATTEIYSKDGKKIKDTDLKKGQKIICIYDSSLSPTFPALEIVTQE